MSKNEIGQDSSIPKFIYLKILRRDGVESLTILEEGEFKVPIEGCISGFRISRSKLILKQEKSTPHYIACSCTFLPQKILFLTQISKCSTPTDLHHPALHLEQFFSLESLKISYAYAKTSLGLKMEKFLCTIVLLMLFL